MIVCYERELSGDYHITMTPGVWLTEKDVLRGDRWRKDMEVQMAVSCVWTQPGMRLIATPSVLERISLRPAVGEKQRANLQGDQWGSSKLLLLDEPTLAVTGHLMGWKIIRIDFPENRPVVAVFFDTLNAQLIELEMVDMNSGETPSVFGVDAMGENGMTRYEYSGLVDGKPVIWEKSSRHERTVTIVGSGKCKVEETIV